MKTSAAKKSRGAVVTAAFPPVAAWGWRLAIVVAWVGSSLVAGCNAVQSAANVPGQAVSAVTPDRKDKDQLKVDPVEVQQNLLRFADEFSMRMTIGVEKLRHGTAAFSPAEALQWKIAINTETGAIASGPNSVANLLDMTVFVTALRMALEEHAQPEFFGQSVQPMLASCRSAEAEIWKLAGTVLVPKQLEELRQALEAWHRKNPLPENVLAVRALGFATEVERASPGEKNKPGSVFGLLKLDPLAGMDPAVREIAQTRLLAERGLFLTQRMPQLLRWQLELLSVNAAAMPATQQLVANTTQLAAAADRISRTAEQLPAQFSLERAAIIKALDEQEKQLTPLVAEVHQTVGSVTELSASLNTTVGSVDHLMKRFGVGEPKPPGPPAPPGEPFHIQDYEKAARQLTEMIQTLNQTLNSPNLEKLSAQVGPVVQQAQAGGKEVVDYAFWKAIQLLLAVLVAALIYRFVSARILSAARAKATQP